MKSKIFLALIVLNFLIISILPASAAEVLQNPLNPVVFTDRVGASMTWILTSDDFEKVTLQYSNQGGLTWSDLYSENNQYFKIDGNVVNFSIKPDSNVFERFFRLKIQNSDGIVYSDRVSIIINDGTMADTVQYIAYKASDASAGNLTLIILTMVQIVSGLIIVWFAARFLVKKVKKYVS